MRGCSPVVNSGAVHLYIIQRLRQGKSYKSFSSGKFRILQCPQNSGICDNRWTEIYVSNVGVTWWNPQILMTYPQSTAFHSPFLTLNASFSIPLHQISLIQPHFSIFNCYSSILSWKDRIFDSKSPQNIVISDKMSLSAACSVFQVWHRWAIHSGHRN